MIAYAFCLAQGNILVFHLTEGRSVGNSVIVRVKCN